MDLPPLPAPMEEVKPIDKCESCRYWIGKRWFGVQMLCGVYFDGHDWKKDECKNYEEGEQV